MKVYEMLAIQAISSELGASTLKAAGQAVVVQIEQRKGMTGEQAGKWYAEFIQHAVGGVAAVLEHAAPNEN